MYDTPEYRELIDWIKQRKAHLRVFLDVHYTKSELNKVGFFRLAPSYPLELEGKFSRDYGTKHRDQCNKDYFCLMCGELIGDVFVLFVVVVDLIVVGSCFVSLFFSCFICML